MDYEKVEKIKGISMENKCPSSLAKQESRENNPTSVHGAHSALSEHPPNQLLLVSFTSQEEFCHLPGRLRINPSLWDKEDVAHWLHWARKEYSLRRPEKGPFEMNGRALCLLTKEDFRCRCPSSGDVLYEILQYVKQQRCSMVCDHPNSSPSLPTHNIQRPFSGQISPGCVQEPKQLLGNYNPAPATVVTAENSQPKPTPPAIDASMSFSTNPAQLSHTTVSVEPRTQVQSPPQIKSIIQEPLNLSRRTKPRSLLHKVNGRIPECRLLWDYVYKLLCDERYQEYIRWQDRDSLVFKVVDPNGLARLWGNHKNRNNMTYEKMSRALRHYYKLNIIKKERGQKLLFRFLKLPEVTRKEFAEPAESPVLDSSQNFSDISIGHDFSGDHFEVSPDHASPRSPS